MAKRGSKGPARKEAKLRLLTCEAAVNEVRTRIPFRYGKASLTAAPQLLLRLEVEGTGGKRAAGLASDCLPPLWFDKTPGKGFRRNVEDQLAAIEKAREIYLLLGDSPRTAAELWREAYPRIMEEAVASDLNALTASFGSSFLERAIVDALCRLEGVSFFEALKSNLLGMETAEVLPEKPLEVIACRHTVGLTDPLAVGEIPPNERLDDGLPQALEEDIEFYGLRYFKVKVSGDHDRDLERLSRVAALLAQRCRSGYRISLDGNEQYHNLDDVHRLVEALRSRPYGQEFLDAVIFIEQPMPRELALEPRAAARIGDLSRVKPVIIDESDDAPDSFRRAVELGYRGTSHKNCKGIFRSLLNRAAIRKLNAEKGEALYFQSGEDLVNLPVIPLQQDLASLSALGIEHAERNGHHYFRGLGHLPREEAEAALAAHPELYEARGEAIFLRIVDGDILCGSVAKAVGYGYSSAIAFAARTPLQEWSFERLGLEDKK